MAHRHPSLRRPISEEQFLREFAAVWARLPLVFRRIGRGLAPVVVLGDDEALEREHERNCRRYAEVEVRRRRFYFARPVLWLPARNRLGLIAHEIGHVMTPGGSEDDADRAAADLGVRVCYDRRWPGKGLQAGRRTA